MGPSPNAHGGISSVERLILDHAPAEIRIRFVSTMRDGNRLSKLRTLLGGIREARRHLPEHELAHVHVASDISIYRKLALRIGLTGLPIRWVIHAHGGNFDNYFRAQARPVRAMIARFLNSATEFITLSDRWKAFYVSECGLPEARVHVLRNPVGKPSSVEARHTGSPTTFVFLGSMDERKGAFRAIEAFASLPESYRRRCQLVVAGNGDVARARALVNSLGVGNSILVRDWIDPTQRDGLLASASVYVLPSLNEGLPMGMLEAMAAGLPVITSPVGGIPEVVTQGKEGYLVPPRSIVEIAQAMRALADRPDVRLAMGDAARRAVEPLQIEHYWPRLASVYESALRNTTAYSDVNVLA